MKKPVIKGTLSRWTARAVILSLCMMFWSATAVSAELSRQKDDAQGTACPLASGRYHISLASTELEGKAGRPFLIRLNLSPYPPPAGFFYATAVDVLEGPEGPKPEILPGDREIRVRCLSPGRYRLLIRVNLIAKSSCGGAKARILKEEKVWLHITL